MLERLEYFRANGWNFTIRILADSVYAYTIQAYTGKQSDCEIEVQANDWQQAERLMEHQLTLWRNRNE